MPRAVEWILNNQLNESRHIKSDSCIWHQISIMPNYMLDHNPAYQRDYYNNIFVLWLIFIIIGIITINHNHFDAKWPWSCEQIIAHISGSKTGHVTPPCPFLSYLPASVCICNVSWQAHTVPQRTARVLHKLSWVCPPNSPVCYLYVRTSCTNNLGAPKG